MWLSPLTVRPNRQREQQELYDVGNAAAYLTKEAGVAKITNSLAGRLYLSSSGWLMLDVPTAIVRGAFDALHEPGAELPPGHNGRNMESHVSVMRPEEIEQIGGADKIVERGHMIRYNLGPLRSTKPAGWSEMSKVWFFSVSSTELEKIRKSYGLSGQPKYPFHLTVAVRRLNVFKENDIKKATYTGSTNPTVGVPRSYVSFNPEPTNLPIEKKPYKDKPPEIETPEEPDGQLALPPTFNSKESSGSDPFTGQCELDAQLIEKQAKYGVTVTIGPNGQLELSYGQ